jgi:hypothetical protein
MGRRAVQIHRGLRKEQIGCSGYPIKKLSPCELFTRSEGLLATLRVNLWQSDDILDCTANECVHCGDAALHREELQFRNEIRAFKVILPLCEKHKDYFSRPSILLKWLIGLSVLAPVILYVGWSCRGWYLGWVLRRQLEGHATNIAMPDWLSVIVIIGASAIVASVVYFRLAVFYITAERDRVKLHNVSRKFARSIQEREKARHSRATPEGADWISSFLAGVQEPSEHDTNN